MQVMVSGSSGLLGTALRSHLAATGHEVVPLVRRPAGEGERRWDPDGGTVDPAVFDGIDAVVNLNGVGIGDRRLTPGRKRAILESRVGTTTLLAAGMAGRPERPAVFVSQSAIGYYGDAGDAVLTESSPPGTDFVADVVRQWEEASRPAAAAGVRTVTTRTGLVLTGKGGLMGRLLLPFRLGIGGRLGSGGQWWSWVTIDDWVRAVSHLLASDVEGPVNVTAPKPVTNAEFTAALGRKLHRPTAIPLPRWALGVVLGFERADSLVFSSARVIPARLTADGFGFTHPDIDTALGAVLKRFS